MRNRYVARSRLSEHAFRRFLRHVAADLTAVQIAQLTGLNRNTVNRLLARLRLRMAEACEAQKPFRGAIEVDESYFGPRRVKGKAGGGAAVPIRLRHYGPVTWDTLNGNPYRVERRPLGADPATAWTDESACFTQTRDPQNPTIIILTPALDEVLHPGFEYRAVLRQFGSPASNVLRCELPSGARPAVADQTPNYAFTIGAACLGDANSDGEVTFLDTTTVLANFNSATTGCLDLACGDANRDGVVNFTDVSVVLANFGNTCPENAGVPCQTFQIPGGGQGGENMMAAGGMIAVQDALVAMGYQGIDDFVAAIMLMPVEQRNEEVQRLGDFLMNGGPSGE